MNRRTIVLAHAHDAGARAVAARLAAALGPSDLIVARPETLGLAGWSQRIGSSGEVQTTLRLPSGLEIHSAEVACLFNRLQYLPAPRFSRASVKDREYASAELQALVASWLYSLGPRVVNPAGPRGQAQGPLSRRGWLALAASCDLPVRRSLAATAGRVIGVTLPGERIQQREPWPGGVRGPAPADLEPDRSANDAESVLLVAGERVVGPLAGRFGEACRAVAQRAGCSLLAFRFARLDGELALLEVDPLPPLSEPWAEAATVELLRTTANQCERVR